MSVNAIDLAHLDFSDLVKSLEKFVLVNVFMQSRIQKSFNSVANRVGGLVCRFCSETKRQHSSSMAGGWGGVGDSKAKSQVQ